MRRGAAGAGKGLGLPGTPSGKSLKIYIKASDPDGDMTWVCVAAGRGKQVTTGAFPIRLSREAGKSLNGYIYWDTSTAEKNISGTAAITIENSKGQQSETKSVFVEIRVGKDVKAEKAPTEFQDVPIGPVLLDNVRYR